MNFGHQVLKGSALSYGSFLVSKVLVYVATLILARLLMPTDFGLVGLGLLVISFLDVVSDLGIGSAVIFRQNADDADDSEAFLLSIAAGVLFAGFCWIIAPAAAGFFHEPRVTALLRALGCTFILVALSSVHAAKLQRELRFAGRYVPDVAMAVVKGVVSVGLALHGGGYWSLVWGQLGGIAAKTVVTWWLLGWVPSFRIRWQASRDLLRYGGHVSLVNLLGALITNGDYLIVGRLLGPAALGLYTLAYTIPQMLTINLCVALSGVVFPAYARMRDDHAALGRGYLNVLGYTSQLLIPVSLLMCAGTPAFVHLVYPPRWWPSISAMQLLSLYGLLYAVGWNGGDVFKAIGRPDILWKTSLGLAATLLPALFLGARVDGITGVAIAHVSVGVPYNITRFWIAQRILRLPMRALFVALRAPVMAGLTMLVPMFLLDAVPLAPLALLALQLASGSIAYALVLWSTDSDTRSRLTSIRAMIRARRPVSAADTVSS